MKKLRFGPAIALIAAGFLLSAHLALNAIFKSHSDAISYVFFLLLSLAALAACAWRFVRCPFGARRGLLLLSAALFLWSSATLLAAYAQFFQHASNYVASIDDFVYFYYGVPILLAIALPDESQLIPVFFWLDGVQAAAVGFLAYVALYAVLPFSGGPQHPMSVDRLIWIYDVEDFGLALFATLRLMVCPRRSAERRFFEILSSYLWIYAVCATVYNHIVSVHNDAGMLDVLVDLPFVFLVLGAAYAPLSAALEVLPKQRKPIALFMDNARPVLLGLALVALCAWVAQTHFRVAMGIIFGAFVVYGVRSAILHSRYSRSQTALEEARDRLADLAMLDGLTGIANRRAFDIRFASEWRRAHRTRAPLALLLIDIDHFKALNDTHGHLTGDESLVQVASTLNTIVNRPGDTLARYGGEEFVALLPETDAVGARNVAARMQEVLHNTPPVPTVERQVTVSIGVTAWEEDGYMGPETILDTADRALYLAKQNGRNRIEYMPLPKRAAS